MDLAAQFVCLITRQGSGVFEEFFGVGDQGLKICHQYFLSILCCLASHGFLRQVAYEGFEYSGLAKVHFNCRVQPRAQQLVTCVGA
ncbi:hypothetical protein PSCICG_01080 [Pseudomonas cichorii]|nr:hypothetical protein PSCICG_01080 [Pseudomonas cichorii]